MSHLTLLVCFPTSVFLVFCYLCRGHHFGRQDEKDEEEFLHEINHVVASLLGGHDSPERDAARGMGGQQAAEGVGQGGIHLKHP